MLSVSTAHKPFCPWTSSHLELIMSSLSLISCRSPASSSFPLYCPFSSFVHFSFQLLTKAKKRADRIRRVRIVSPQSILALSPSASSGSSGTGLQMALYAMKCSFASSERAAHQNAAQVSMFAAALVYILNNLITTTFVIHICRSAPVI